jgi:hypothetical protein
MNFDNLSLVGLGFLALFWGVLLGLAIWFVRTVTSVATSLREIAERLASLERAVRDAGKD